jgi:hypothetical protein
MFREFPKRGSSPLFGFNSSNVWNDWNPGMERLEPTLVFNGLNGAQRLNDWNDWNWLLHGWRCARGDRAENGGWRGGIACL